MFDLRVIKLQTFKVEKQFENPSRPRKLTTVTEEAFAGIVSALTPATASMATKMLVSTRVSI